MTNRGTRTTKNVWHGAPVIVVAATLAFTAIASVASFGLSAPRLKTSLSHFSSSIKTASQFGGSVGFSATLKDSKKCVLSVKPAVPGLPSTTSCTKSSYETSVELPVNATSKSLKYVFKLTVSGHGTATATASVGEDADTVAVSSTWSTPISVEGIHGTPSSISCASSTFCAYVDDNGNAAETGGSLTSVDSSGLTGISCPTSTFCVAVDDEGDYVTFNGTTWSAPTATGSAPLTAVSCVSSTDCVAVDQLGEATTFNGASWTTPTSIDTLAVPNAISCTAEGDCVVTDGAGDAIVESGGVWTATVNVDSNGLTSVACAAPSDCVATDDDGNVVSWNGSSWSGLTDIDGNTALTGISCFLVSSDIHCVAVDSGGSDMEYDGTWSSPTTIDSGNDITSVSCANSTTCEAVDAHGNLISYNNSSWTSSLKDGTNGFLSAVACGTATDCLAVGTNGEYSTFNGSTWSTVATSPVPELESVSCAGTFCATGGDNGKIVTRSGSSWGAVKTVGSATITAIDCLSSKFCIAGNIVGQYSVWSGSNWTSPQTLDVNYGRGFGSVSCLSPAACIFNDHNEHEMVWRTKEGNFLRDVDAAGGDLTGVACPNSSQCLIVDITGNVATATDSPTSFSWTAMSHLDNAGITSISCANSFYCGAVDQSGDFLQWFNGKWSTPVKIDTSPLVSVSCSPDGRCTAIDQNDDAVTTLVK